ncbi:Secologanin synthase [Rhynchospora pubera]|uniref:Secologanin synthase n=1 Tax=Rhynchospora pubera TaxID=906938 RepID=A0AAV8CQH2_9POAL|nr:Secologanin synthase [Rhynchospora pubera]
MNRHYRNNESPSQSASSIFASESSQSAGIPIVGCPECGLAVKRLVSGTMRNPERVFYRCVNQKTRCDFWKWEDAYLRYLTKANMLNPSIQNDAAGTVQSLERLEAQMDCLTIELEKKYEHHDAQIKDLVASLENLRLFNCIIFILLVTVLIIVLVIGTGRVGRIE